MKSVRIALCLLTLILAGCGGTDTVVHEQPIIVQQQPASVVHEQLIIVQQPAPVVIRH